ncbi:MAG: 2'-5' RNA ligase family protein [Candidatus Altiarchaeota archaeon]
MKLDFLRGLLGWSNEVTYGGPYLIEFRFFGSSQDFVRDLCRHLSHEFEIRQNARGGRPAHITLYGGFDTKDEEEMINRFMRVCKRCDLVEYTVSGVSHIGDKVISLDVSPSDELKQLREELARELNPICSARQWDKPGGEFIFHTTLANHIERKIDKLWEYLKNLKTPKIREYVIRITLLKNGMILREYDLIQRRRLNRREALNQRTYAEDIRFIKEFKQNGGKRTSHVLGYDPKSKDKLYLISDLHLDHTNIIKYCKRPFKDVNEMNDTLVENWNKTVKPNDNVIFLGDLSYGRESRGAEYWLPRLNGKIRFIEGNHEDVHGVSVKTYPPAHNVFLRYGEQEFLLTHDPAIKPLGWEGWTIHGHKHNNDLKNFPFINKDEKTINVSVETIEYKPISMNVLVDRLA